MALGGLNPGGASVAPSNRGSIDLPGGPPTRTSIDYPPDRRASDFPSQTGLEGKASLTSRPLTPNIGSSEQVPPSQATGGASGRLSEGGAAGEASLSVSRPITPLCAGVAPPPQIGVGPSNLGGGAGGGGARRSSAGWGAPPTMDLVDPGFIVSSTSGAEKATTG